MIRRSDENIFMSTKTPRHEEEHIGSLIVLTLCAYASLWQHFDRVSRSHLKNGFHAERAANVMLRVAKHP